MRVSVIIPNYNYAQYLPYAIDSLLAQTVKPDEIIVVDDGSVDHSRDVMMGYGDKITAIYQTNSGQASAISRGFASSTGDIVCILDSDDMFFPDKVRIIKETYLAHPDAQFVFHTLRHMKPEEAQNISSYPNFMSINGKMIDQMGLMRFQGKLDYDAPATSGLTFRRNFIAPLFPLPMAESITISDHYIKFYALGIGKGYAIDDALGGQIIHGENLYTGAKAIATKARIFSNTALALYRKLPELKKFCTNIMMVGLLSAYKAGNIDQIQSVAAHYIENLNIVEKSVLTFKIQIKRGLGRI